ncbi:MAG: bifunctional UDP-N-acetylglucosamine diphosphorylase/glucosamine-1-phosphate N-acetyltransferase GlmU [Alphaproteobacteria bacterium]|nr:bifunctional UDP-N-acetylglucosamine diphosphorylase/glucosamine-1-phosphate N-acetyltransferase GlmU [Alphaproteobacteria bacterium]
MSEKSLRIVILAAGRGSRMKSGLPKVLHPLAGLPMIGWLLKTAESLDPEKIIIVVSPDMPDLEKAVTPHEIAIQPVANGTGGALKAALPALEGFGGDVLVLLGDTPLISPDTLRGLIKARKGGSALSLLGCVVEDSAGYGRVLLNADGTLRTIVEEKDATAEERAVKLVNTGAFCLDGARLAGWAGRLDDGNAQKEFYITQIPAAAAEGGAVVVTVTEDVTEVRGCNAREDLAALEKTVQNRLRRQALRDGVTMMDPESVYFNHDTFIAPDVLIEPQVFFGPGVRVERGAVIRAFSYLEGVVIGEGASVGPFARLRPGSEIGEGARIGNFVEIKNSSIGAGSKVGHLAYVGDCAMGAEVNFSAGAITVNYDGVDKHRTVIGEGAMIGSNVNLVAPVEIGKNAYIAAGSTITRNIPADALAIARERETIREGGGTGGRKTKR